MRIHTIDDPDLFADGDTDLSQTLRSELEDGLTQPDWWFVAEDASGRVGRLALRRQYTCDEQWRGSLPEHEIHVLGVDTDWDHHPERVIGPLAKAAAEAASPQEVGWRIGTYHDHAAEKSAAAAALGLPMFHEKVGFVWEDDGGALVESDRLRFASVDEVGRAEYAEVLSRAVEGGPDREAAWYVSQMPERGWGEVMMGALAEEDLGDWLVAWVGTEIAGQVAITSFDPEYGDGTIVWIGVVPEHRGRGFGVDLLREAQRRARRRGFRSLLSDTDTRNLVMQKTFLRTGHRQADWHVWHHRWRV